MARFQQNLLVRLLVAALVLLAWLHCAPSLMGQQLGEMRQQVRPPAEPPPPSEPHDHGSRRRRSRDEAEDQFWSELLSPIAGAALYATGYAATSPFWGPPIMMGDDYNQPAYFLDYPFQYNEAGNVVIDPAGYTFCRPWTVQARSEYLDDFNDLSAVGGRVLFEHTSRFGIDSETYYRRESLGMGGHDSLWTGDANIVFRFAQSPRAQLRAGLGVNWLSDRLGSDFGVNFTYGGDWFICNPLVSSTEFDVGTLGGAELFHLRSTLGLHWRHLELYAGYDIYQVGGVTFDGLVSGARIWW